MAWPYVFVFLGALLFDVVPFPFLPAFTIMLFLQLRYHLAVWAVLALGVSGSVLGRYLLTRYIPALAGRFFNAAKNADVRFLGQQLRTKGWKSQLVVGAYSLLPLPTTPLFVAAGMARVPALYVVPAFFVGKLTSDALVVSAGHYAAQNMASLRASVLSWQTVAGLLGSVLLLLALLFINWRTLIQHGQFKLEFSIFNRGR